MVADHAFRTFPFRNCFHGFFLFFELKCLVYYFEKNAVDLGFEVDIIVGKFFLILLFFNFIIFVGNNVF